MSMNLSPEHEEHLRVFWDDRRESLSAVMDKLDVAQRKLDEEQLFNCFVQALIAGDFVKQVVQGSGAQNFIYVPYRECERLRAENQRLKEILSYRGIPFDKDDGNTYISGPDDLKL